jgi:hypothetical protein
MELSEQPLAVKNVVQFGLYVAGCFSFDCKLYLYVFDGNLTGQKYRDNVLAPRVVPHFDNHALAEQLCPTCGCPEMKCFVCAKRLRDRR